MVEKELGAPINDMFEYFSKRPIASGSIAQVYKAKLKRSSSSSRSSSSDNDNTVAVKVRHPGVAEQITIDFTIMNAFCTWIERFEAIKQFGLSESMLQFSATISAQTNLATEGVHLAIFNRNFKSLPRVLFPVPHILTESVLIESFETGQSVAEYTSLYNSKRKNGCDNCLNGDIKNSPLASAIISLGIDIYLKMLLQDNLMHADFHPGNIMIQASSSNHINTNNPDTPVKKGLKYDMVHPSVSNPNIVLVDAGMVAKLSRKEQTNFIGLLQAMGNGDGRSAAKCVMSFSDNIDNNVYSKQQQKGFENAMQKLFNEQCRGYDTGVDLGVVLRSVLQLVRIHQIRIDANYATLVMNALCLDGLASQLIPGYRVLDGAKALLNFHSICKRTPFRIGLSVFYTTLPIARYFKHRADSRFDRFLKQGINLHKRNAEKVDMKSKKKDSTTTVPLVIEEDKIKTGLRMWRR